MAKHKYVSLEEISRAHTPQQTNHHPPEAPAEEEAVEVRTLDEIASEDHALATHQSVAATQYDDLIHACGDGFDLPVDQAKQDIHECYKRAAGEMITIGKRLILIKQKLAHGEFLQYLTEEFPETPRRAQQYMLIARRFIGREGKNEDVFAFHQKIAGPSRDKNLLLLGVSDEEIDTAMKSDEFLGHSLEEVGALSYRQLKEELRKRERDLERARAQRDKADSKIEDLTEEVLMLRQGEDEEPKEFTNLEVVWGKTRIQMGRLQVAIQDADEEEVIASGAAMLNALQRELDLLIPLLQPEPPGAPVRVEKGGGR